MIEEDLKVLVKSGFENRKPIRDGIQGGERFRPSSWMQKLHSEVVRRPHKKPGNNLNADNELALAA